jgi:hypothetical protein
LAAIELPVSINLSAILPAVRNQGKWNSCVGHGFGGIITAHLIAQGKYSQWASVQEPWNLAREMEDTLDQNVGVYPRDAAKGIKKYGYMLEFDWQYNMDNLDVSGMTEARRKLCIAPDDLQYTRVDNGLDGIRQCLADSAREFANGKPAWLITIGTPWPQSKWDNPDCNGNVPEVSKDDFEDAGHEYIIYGYDDSTQRLLCMNSWGSDWGNCGLFSVPYSSIPVFKSLTGYDAFYLQFTVPVKPVQGKCRIAVAHQLERIRRGLKHENS